MAGGNCVRLIDAAGIDTARCRRRWFVRVTSLALSCFAPVRTAIYLNFIAVSTILPTARYSPTLLPLWASLIALLTAVAVYAWRGPFLKE